MLNGGIEANYWDQMIKDRFAVFYFGNYFPVAPLY